MLIVIVILVVMIPRLMSSGGDSSICDVKISAVENYGVYDVFVNGTYTTKQDATNAVITIEYTLSDGSTVTQVVNSEGSVSANKAQSFTTEYTLTKKPSKAKITIRLTEGYKTHSGKSTKSKSRSETVTKTVNIE